MYYISIESHGGNQLNRSTKESSMTFIESLNFSWNGKTYYSEKGFILMPLKASDNEVRRFRMVKNKLNLGYNSLEHAELFAITDELHASDLR
jgi:hypothetical protein